MLFSSSLHSPIFDVLGLDVYPIPCPRPCPQLFPGLRPARPEFRPCPANLAWVIIEWCLVKIFRSCFFWLVLKNIRILNILTVDSQLTKLHLHFASTKSSTFVRLASRQLKINVGRRGTNWAQSPPDLEWYLDVLVKHTTEVPPPAALVEGVLLRWFILSCEYFISLNQIHAHTCYQPHVGNESPILENLSEISWNPSPISRCPSPKIQFSSHKIQFSPIGFLLTSMAFCFLQRLSAVFNGFPIFLNGFPLSEKSEKIYLWREVYERSLFELRIFRHSLPELRDYW